MQYMPKKNKDDVSNILEEISLSLKRQNALGYTFMQGMVRGMGTAFGATVLVAIITSITLNFFGSAETSAIFQAIGALMID